MEIYDIVQLFEKNATFYLVAIPTITLADVTILRSKLPHGRSQGGPRGHGHPLNSKSNYKIASKKNKNINIFAPLLVH